MDIQDYWGWTAPFFIWIVDHYSFIFALILVLLQILYQIIRIRHINKYGIKDRRN
jgi:hypothetical protein